MSVVSPETLPENIPNLSDEDLLRLYNQFASIPAGVSQLTNILHNRAQLLKAEIERRDQQKERAKSFAQWKAEMFQEIHLHDDQMNTLRETASQAKRVCHIVCGFCWALPLGCRYRVIQRMDTLKRAYKRNMTEYDPDPPHN